MVETVVFVLLAVALPVLVWAGRGATREALLSLEAPGEGVSRVGLYKEQSVVSVGIGVVACLPLVFGGATPGDYGLGRPGGGAGGWAGFWIVVGVLGAYWVGLRVLVVAVGRRAGLRRLIRAWYPDQLHALMPRDGRELRWWGVLSGSAGLGEELAFRGFMIWYLAGFLGVWWAVLASSVLFALLHVWEGRWAVLVILWLGLVFGAMFVWSGWLYMMIAVHAVHNLEMGRVWMAMRRAGGFGPGPAPVDAPVGVGSNNRG